MDERSNRRLLILIAGLVVVVLALAILTLNRFVSDIGTLVPWPIALAISFNVIILVVTAVITVGHFDVRPVARFLALAVGVKAIETLLTAGGYALTADQLTFGPALIEAALGSWLASVLHAIGALVVCWLLRDLLVGQRLALEAPPDGIILPLLEEAEMEPGEPTPAEELWVAPPEPDVDPLRSPIASQREQAEGEEELDRVVAAATPATVDLEAIPEQELIEPESEPAPALATDSPEPAEAEPEIIEEEYEPEPAEAAAFEPAPPTEARSARADDVLLTVGEVLACFKPENLALSADEVREQRGGDDAVRVPLDAVLAQIEDGVVFVEPDLIFGQLPSETFARSHEEIVAGLWRRKLELPLPRVVAQLPAEALRRAYEAVQTAADEFPNPFLDTLASERLARDAAPAEPVTEPPAVAAEAAYTTKPEGFVQATRSVAEHAEEEEPESAPVEATSPEPVEEVLVDEAEEPKPVSVEVPPAEPAPAGPVEQIEEVETPPLVEATRLEPVEAAWGSTPPGLLSIDAEYVVAQFPENATTMPIEEIEAKLRPHGKLQVPYDEVLPQLTEGCVAVDINPLLEQFPPGAINMSWSDLRDSLPDGKVRLPLEQLVGQIPADALTPGLEQIDQERTDEIPEPFHETLHAGPELAEEAAPEQAQEEPPEEVVPEPEEAAQPAPAGTLEVPWLELLPQFPAEAFCVSRDQLQSKLEGKAALIEMELVRPQLSEGRITVPCGPLLAQFPDEYLEMPIEQIADQLPDGRFEIPLVTVVLQLPPDELALPTDQELQDSTHELPTIFAEPSTAQGPEEPTPEEPPAEAEEAVTGEPPAEKPEAFEAAADKLPGEPVAESAPEPAEWAAPEHEEPIPALETPPPDETIEELSETDIEQLETLLAEKREGETGLEDEAEFVDDVFVAEQEPAPDVTMPLAEPEAPELGEEPVAELFGGEPEAEVPTPAEAAEEPEPVPMPADEAVPEPVQAAPEPVEEAPEPFEEAYSELVEEARDDGGQVAPAPPPPEPVTVDRHPAERENEMVRDLLHGYAKYHVEHGHAYLEEGRPVFSFTPAETSAEELALQLPPRLDALARLAQQLGCDPPERAVLTADKGAIVCEWLPEETDRGLLLISTTDKRAAGLMHLEAHRDTEFVMRLTAQLYAEPTSATSPKLASAGLRSIAPEECEVAWPDGPPFEQIGELLAAYRITKVALLQFESGARWMLASALDLDERAISPQGWYNPSELFDLPGSLRLGRVHSALVIAGRHIITVNAPTPGNALGLVCVFPGQFREGLLRMKADKASTLLCGV